MIKARGLATVFGSYRATIAAKAAGRKLQNVQTYGMLRPQRVHQEFLMEADSMETAENKPTKELSVIDRAVAAINGDTDEDRRIVTVVWFLTIAQNGRGPFPAIGPAPDPAIIDALVQMGCIKPEDASKKWYIFCASKKNRETACLLMMDKATSRLTSIIL